MKRLLAIFCLAPLGLALAVTPVTPKKDSKQASIAVRKVVTTLVTLSLQSANDAKFTEAFKAQLRHSVEWEEIAIASIGKKAWAEQKPKQQKEFVSVMSNVLVLSAVASQRQFWKRFTRFTVSDVSVKGERASAKVVYEGTAKEDYDFLLHFSEGRWKIVDIPGQFGAIRQQVGQMVKAGNFNSMVNQLNQLRLVLEAALAGSVGKK